MIGIQSHVISVVTVSGSDTAASGAGRRRQALLHPCHPSKRRRPREQQDLLFVDAPCLIWCREAFGKRGLACQPAIIGIGLGGSKDICMTLGKRASTLRVVGSRNSDPRIAEMEDEFKELGNSIGMGAMGFVGKNMVIDCNIEVGYCHTGGMQMSVHAFCLSSRRAVARLFPDGRVEYRTDPDWFTPYQRRESVDWAPILEAAE